MTFALFSGGGCVSDGECVSGDCDSGKVGEGEGERGGVEGLARGMGFAEERNLGGGENW